jgi:hypothetical protein
LTQVSDVSKTLGELHDALAEEMLRRVKNPECSAAEMAVAVKFLKDNGIDVTRRKGTPLDNLTKELEDELPFQNGELHA